MDPMCPLPKNGDFLEATQFRTLHEGDKPIFWVMQTCHAFLPFGVEAGVIY